MAESAETYRKDQSIVQIGGSVVGNPYHRIPQALAVEYSVSVGPGHYEIIFNRGPFVVSVTGSLGGGGFVPSLARQEYRRLQTS
jgi:hypothetical protein